MSSLTQSFGDNKPLDLIPQSSIISAVSFDHSGDFLASGLRNGHINIYNKISDGNSVKFNSDASDKDFEDEEAQDSSEMGGQNDVIQPQYELYTSFRSHEPEFDYLKSLEIEERINQIVWCPPIGRSRLLLSTNDKTIKLWKVYESSLKSVSPRSFLPKSNSFSTSSSRSSTSSDEDKVSVNELISDGSLEGCDSEGKDEMETELVLEIPTLTTNGSVVKNKNKKTFSNAHAYHVNSISLNSDGETFLSADDLRILWWNLEVDDRAYNIVDTKPEHMEDLVEVIMAARFHPSLCHLFAWSSSRGRILVADTRERALCDGTGLVFGDDPSTASSPTNVQGYSPQTPAFFNEIISSTSDLQFHPSDPHILTRDYMTLKLWDLRSNSAPLLTYNIHEHLRDRLPDLYDSDNIFDKFQCAISSCGTKFATGSYNGNTMVFDRDALKEGEPFSTTSSSSSSCEGEGGGVTLLHPSLRDQKIPFARPLLTPSFLRKNVVHVDFHPTDPILVAPQLNKLNIFRTDGKRKGEEEG